MRCWGSSNPAESKGLSFERSDCQMDTAIFINESLRTGDMAVRHEVYDGKKLGALRFAQEAGQSFRNEGMGRRTHDLTAPKCQEDFVENAGLPMRTVLCMRAYRHLPGLYDVAVLSRQIRSSDVIGRLGGDEFALLLWNLSETDARAKATSLEADIDRLSFAFAGNTVATGVSAGVASLSPHSEAARALADADCAMYVRKAQRRHEVAKSPG